MRNCLFGTAVRSRCSFRQYLGVISPARVQSKNRELDHVVLRKRTANDLIKLRWIKLASYWSLLLLERDLPSFLITGIQSLMKFNVSIRCVILFGL